MNQMMRVKEQKFLKKHTKTNIIKIPYDIVYTYNDEHNTIKYIEKKTN